MSFLERFPHSYAQINVTIEEEGHFVAFLEAPFAISSLHLRVAVIASKISYLGSLVWGGILLGTELQLTGEVKSAELLAERLAKDVTVIRCFFFASTGES